MDRYERFAVDERRWPGVARVPDGPLLGHRAELSRRAFRRALLGETDRDSAAAPDGEARDGASEVDGAAVVRGDIEVRDEAAMFRRVAEADWVGLGESYLAGEWESRDVPGVLARLLGSGLDVGPGGRVNRGLRRISGRRPVPRATRAGGELPASLIELYAGPTLAAGSALFASGARTTVLEDIPNQAQGAGRGGVPGTWKVDVTRIDAPEGVARRDLMEAQARRIDRMLDLGRVRAGDRILEWPSTGGDIALRAADRGASADVLAVADDHAEVVRERAGTVGLSGAVRVLRSDDTMPSPRDFDADYDAIFNVERLETLGPSGMRAWLRRAERVLADRGTIVVQMAVATPLFDDVAGDAVDLLRSYIWPALHYPTMDEIRRVVDRDTGLRIIGETHMAAHAGKTIELWRGLFVANTRQAAGLGYDRVYRRLWEYNLSLQEALLATGRLDVVQLELVAAPRRRR